MPHLGAPEAMVLGRLVQASRQVQPNPSCQLAVCTVGSTVGADSRTSAAPGGFPYWGVCGGLGWGGHPARC